MDPTQTRQENNALRALTAILMLFIVGVHYYSRVRVGDILVNDIIYNAFPHFDEPDQLMKRLSSCLRPGGTLSVCHGMSREKIIEHHKNVSHVSHLLPEAEQMKELMGRYLKVSDVISDEKMYLVCGIRE